MIDGYWNEKRIALAIIALALHVGILVNVWKANQLTPRVINVEYNCEAHAAPRR